jgi:[ribosomal protein S18]-alanine N-acetyltransferase
VEYRLYKAEDFESLYAIEEVCFQPPFRFNRSYVRQLVTAPNAATWIAETHGKMAGFAIVEWMHQARSVHAYLTTIEVLREYRSRGAGSELLQRTEGTARGVGAKTMWLHVDPANKGAIRLYESHGYVYFNREEHFYGPGRGALLYKKSLSEAAPPAA